MLSWSTKRRILYGGGFIAFIIIVIAIPTFFVLYEPPTCFDNKQNGNETGIDCGGSCELLCVAEVSPPSVKWTRVFRVSEGVYSAIAQIENSNFKVDAKNTPYVLKLYDAENVLVLEVEGSTPIPASRTFPVFEGNMVVGNRNPTKAILSFKDEPIWNKVPEGYEDPDLVLTNQKAELSSGLPRLSATLSNRSLYGVSDIFVYAIITNSEGNTIGASRTVVEFIRSEGSQNVVFTWPEPFTDDISKVEIIPIVYRSIR